MVLLNGSSSHRLLKYCFMVLFLVDTAAMAMDSKQDIGSRSIEIQLDPKTAYPEALVATDSFGSLLLANGQISTWGSKASQISWPLPKQNVIQIAAGRGHMLALTDKGYIYAWGENEHGELGDGTRTARFKPTRVASELRFIQVVAKSRHSFALTTDGQIYAWGESYESPGGIAIPTQVLRGEIPETVVKIASEAFSLLALTNMGKVFERSLIWPKREKMGLRQVSLSNIVDITAGSNFSLALTNTGEAWAWGYDRDGQLGARIKERCTIEPVRVEIDYFITQIAAGDNFAFAITQQGNTFCWGANSLGQLGLGSKDGYSRPALLPLMNVVQIAASYDHVLAIVYDEKEKKHKLFGWGANFQGQLTNARFSQGYYVSPIEIPWPKPQAASDEFEPSAPVCKPCLIL